MLRPDWGSRVVSQEETGFLCVLWWGGKDSLKKPGFWGWGAKGQRGDRVQ